MKCYHCDNEAFREFAYRHYCQAHWIKRLTGRMPEKPTLPRSEASKQQWEKKPWLKLLQGIRVTKRWRDPEYRQRVLPKQKALGYRNYPDSHHIRLVDKEKDMQFI